MNGYLIVAGGLALGALAWIVARRAEGDTGLAEGPDDNEPEFSAFKIGAGVNRKTISFAGIELIRKFEGFRATVYDANPPKKDWTIGYGHKLKRGETFPEVTREQATKLLVNDLGFAEDRVKTDIAFMVDQKGFDALVSLAFNLTNKSWKAAAARLNRGESVDTVFARYSYAGGVQLAGLVKRRNAEIAMYKLGVFA